MPGYEDGREARVASLMHWKNKHHQSACRLKSEQDEANEARQGLHMRQNVFVRSFLH